MGHYENRGMKRITIPVSEEDVLLLNFLATQKSFERKKHISLSSYVRGIIEKHIKRTLDASQIRKIKKL